DLRVATTEATFGLSAGRHGIVPGLATYRLPRLVGLAAAQEMMLLGETWSAARAHAQGLVHRVVPLRRLDAAATELARTLADNVRAATVATKRLTLRSYDLPLGRFLREYVRDQRACWADAETKSTLARYRAGRWGKADSRITDRRKCPGGCTGPRWPRAPVGWSAPPAPPRGGRSASRDRTRASGPSPGGSTSRRPHPAAPARPPAAR